MNEVSKPGELQSGAFVGDGGCVTPFGALTDRRRFSHVERLREDPTIPELFGMESVVGDDTVRRFFKSVDPVLGADWIALNAKPMWSALPDRIIMDWDSTVQPKYGHQEGTDTGPQLLISGARATLHRVPAEAWQGPNVLGAWQVAACTAENRSAGSCSPVNCRVIPA